ncbi:hypothetical protein GmHk_19G055086 [Glycine max]|nr:hypothetical protein GmHk_19G055086 [Glycine max]
MIGYNNVEEGDAYELLQAMTWASNLDMYHVIFEMDYKNVVGRINNSVQDCKHVLSFCPNFGVKFVKREANMVAHVLGKVVITNIVPLFYSHTPYCIASLIMNEMIKHFKVKIKEN